MVFVVAEIGVNWDGDFELVKKIMSEAKTSGCNAVKFQAYDKNIVKDHPEWKRLMNATISKENIEIIDNLARSVGIEWFCTPMYLEAVEMLDPFVKRFKIRAHDAKVLLDGKTTDLIDAVLKTGKEIIASSARSPKDCKYFQHPKIKWLYVVPKYPCDITDLDFSAIKEYNGYSNHCPHFIAPLTAAILGSEIVEVHITPDKSANFIDNDVSFDFNELKNLVSLIRLSEKMKLVN